MKVEYTQYFDRNYTDLSKALQDDCKATIDLFLDCYRSRQFPKGLRVHRCGPFLSLSISMNYRIFVLPISGGVKFVFVGDHRAADNYLKK